MLKYQTQQIFFFCYQVKKSIGCLKTNTQIYPLLYVAFGKQLAFCVYTKLNEFV